MRIGTDTGGTFTDVVTESGDVVKVLSTRHDPGRAIRSGLAALAGARPSVLAHGTTVATNALLERRGAMTALVTNAGFEDVIEIGRQDRPSLYDPTVVRPEPLIARGHRFGIAGRLGADGAELEPIEPDSLPELPAGVEAVAVCLLHADLNYGHEQAVAARLRERGLDVTCSHEVSPEFREFERTSTTVANAYLRPPCRSYLTGLADAAEEVLVMTSAGGLVPVADAAETPSRILLSGPAGGVLAGAAVAAACGFSDAITFDMGGTSTDVCLVRSGRPEPAGARTVAGFPIRLPSLDVLTIGAGGGSIAVIDAGGALVVGPRSAGAEPGPVCYGMGGIEPTVTDANLVAGHIDPDATFPGLERLDRDSAAVALGRLGVAATDVVRVVDAAMEEALRRVSVARGVDPRGLALVAFGGAGPLHACALAEALDMAAVIVPPRAGVFSAVGILGAPVQCDLVQSWTGPVGAELQTARSRLGRRAAAAIGPEPVLSTAYDCRYAGQSHELTVPTPDEFHDEHARVNGYSSRDRPVEVVAVRASARRLSGLAVTDLLPPERASVVGPAVVVEGDCTIWVPTGWRGEPGPVGALIMRRDGR